MSLRGLSRLLLVYSALLLLAALSLSFWLYVPRDPDRLEKSIVSVWHRGARISRAVVTAGAETALADDATEPDTTRIIEDVTGSAPILSLAPFLFGTSFVAGRDGVEVNYEGRVAYATPDDLIKREAYDLAVTVGNFQLKFGVDQARAFAFLAEELGARLGVALAALAGIVLAPIWGVRPQVGVDAVVPAFLIIVLGGVGSFWGAVIAGLLVGMVVGLTGAFAGDWAIVSMYLLFIAVVTFRARGIAGKKSVLDV